MDLCEIRKNISYHRIQDHNLFIFPAYPSWIVLTDPESFVFDLYLKKIGKDDAIRSLCNEGFSHNEALNIFEGLLSKLEDRHILGDNNIYIAPDAGDFPTNIHLALTHQCNLRCKHCYLSAGNRISSELGFTDWINGFEKVLTTIKAPDITISGGEPATVGFLTELISYLKPKAGRLVLYTNGTNTLGSIPFFVDEVQLSLEGLSASTHDYIRGEGTYKKVVELISNIQDKSKLKIALTILHHNFYEIKGRLMQWLNDHDLKMSNIRFNAELEVNGRAKELPDEFINFLSNNAVDVFKFISEMTKSDKRPFLLMKNMRNCGIGISIGIDSNGDIFPCDAFIDRQGNILDDNIDEVIGKCLQINEQTEIDKIANCFNCDLKYICLGGCKAKNLKTNGSYLKPTCDEKSKYIKYVQMIYDIGL